MNLIDIEKNIKQLISNIHGNEEQFLFQLLRCYGIPKASITKLEKGNLNISTNDKEILWKNKVFFKECKSEGLYKEYTRIIEDDFVLKNKPMFIIITDYQKILALDIETEETIDIDIKELATNYTFFLPWAGMKKAIMQIDNPAEYTGIFEEKIFTKSIVSYTQQDGSDLDYFLKRIFKILNEENRDGYPEYLKKFPYVGGDLFEGEGVELSFNLKSRQAIIDNGELNWAEINPDIFGSMIQAVVNANERSNLGMHYTSVPNIMKVINPLFLDELYEEFENAKKDIVKLKKLITRLSKMKIYDPACGSGNFLIIAYKELRELEMKIIEQINKLDMQVYWQGTSISLSQFYGIEIKDFAQQIAKLSLWLMEKRWTLNSIANLGILNLHYH